MKLFNQESFDLPKVLKRYESIRGDRTIKRNSYVTLANMYNLLIQPSNVTFSHLEPTGTIQDTEKLVKIMNLLELIDHKRITEEAPISESFFALNFGDRDVVNALMDTITGAVASTNLPVPIKDEIVERIGDAFGYFNPKGFNYHNILTVKRECISTSETVRNIREELNTVTTASEIHAEKRYIGMFMFRSPKSRSGSTKQAAVMEKLDAMLESGEYEEYPIPELFLQYTTSLHYPMYEKPIMRVIRRKDNHKNIILVTDACNIMVGVVSLALVNTLMLDYEKDSAVMIATHTNLLTHLDNIDSFGMDIGGENFVKHQYYLHFLQEHAKIDELVSPKNDEDISEETLIEGDLAILKLMHDNVISTAKHGLRRYEEQMQNHYQELRHLMSMLQDAQLTVLAASSMDSKDIFKDLLRILLDSEEVLHFSFDASPGLNLVIKTTLNQYEEDILKMVAKQKDSPDYNMGIQLQGKGITYRFTEGQLLERLFGDNRFIINVIQTIRVNLTTGEVSSLRGYNNDMHTEFLDLIEKKLGYKTGVSGYAQNPHIEYYSCSGTTKLETTKAIASKSYEMLPTILMNSVQNINFADSVVLGRFVRELRERYLDEEAFFNFKDFATDYDGNKYSVADILEPFIEEQ